jgi:hypothetical protein
LTPDYLEREDDSEEPLEGDGQGGEDRPDPEDVNEPVANRKNWRENNFLEKNHYLILIHSLT